MYIILFSFGNRLYWRYEQQGKQDNVCYLFSGYDAAGFIRHDEKQHKIIRGKKWKEN